MTPPACAREGVAPALSSSPVFRPEGPSQISPGQSDQRERRPGLDELLENKPCKGGTTELFRPSSTQIVANQSNPGPQAAASLGLGLVCIDLSGQLEKSEQR